MVNKEDLDFLIRYAKEGVLRAMKGLDPIEADELKDEFIRIKRELMSRESPVPSIAPKQNAGEKKEEKKQGAFGKWLSGIPGRQKAYQEKNKDKLL